jgi:ABC-type bacteriocin/lantibiotic exporter with double-glycine peptidase domain
MPKNVKIIILLFLSLLISSIFIQTTENHIILQVPFIKQKDAYDCGISALMSLLKWKNEQIQYDEVKKEIYSKQAKGTFPISMEIFLRKRKIPYKVVENNPDAIIELLNQKIPSIALLKHGFGVISINHYYVIVGIKDDKVIVHNGLEPYKEISLELFKKKWSKSNYWLLYIQKS